jgi:hypothetical protein
MDAVKPTRANCSRYRRRCHTVAGELCPADDSVLTSGELRQPNCVLSLSLSGSRGTQIGHAQTVASAPSPIYAAV